MLLCLNLQLVYGFLHINGAVDSLACRGGSYLGGEEIENPLLPPFKA